MIPDAGLNERKFVGWRLVGLWDGGLWDGLWAYDMQAPVGWLDNDLRVLFIFRTKGSQRSYGPIVWFLQHAKHFCVK